jgi:hypothetical protein
MGNLILLRSQATTFRIPARKLVSALLLGSALAQTPTPAAPSYYEFGTVVLLGERTVQIQTFDAQKKRTVQHSFALSRNTRADAVRVGDTVEVIYSTGPAANSEWMLRRLVLLDTSIPNPGPPNGDHREVPAPVAIRVVPSVPPPAKSVSPASATLRGGSVKAPSGPTPGSVTLPASGPATAKVPGTSNPVALGSATAARSASVIDVPLGAGEVAIPKVATPRVVAHEMPAEECNRSSAEWPSQPLKLAILDFRYPTEREESHDIGTTGGGSGTAVADLVYSGLDALGQFAMMRGDRTRLYRSDFAGAARVGREIGADAVLAGTFKPVDPPPGSDPDFPPPKTYELSAGIVDTCTGQLLLRLVSVLCPPGLDPNATANGNACKRLSVTAKQASDPKEQIGAFAAPIAALLYPLEHNGPPPGTQGSAGVVTAVNGGTVSIRLPAGVALREGDQVALHAWRLTKNPTTYTLHNLHDEEIGRVTIASVKGGIATGSFAGDFPPQTGDTAELIAP